MRKFSEIELQGWRSQGQRCYEAQLPRWLIRQAFHHKVRAWDAAGRPVVLDCVRAFLEGLEGRDMMGTQKPVWNLLGYAWPECKGDWQLVVCTYDDGPPEFDYIRPGDATFWSAAHGFLDDLPLMADESWLRSMGFELLPLTDVCLEELSVADEPISAKPHLRLVSNHGY